MKTTASSHLMKPQEYFSSLQNPQTPRSQFDRTAENMTAFNAGLLIPVYFDEVLPSDTWKVSQQVLARITTLIKPLMDNLYLDIHWFFTPNRILWSHWVNFMGEQEDPATPVTYTVPQVTVTNGVGGGSLISWNTLGDYFGLPNDIDNLSVNALFFRSYLKTYDDWYRDENFIKETLPVSARGDATVVYNQTRFPVLKRGKRKDYFTSALPWAQKGTAPTLSLGGSAPLIGNPLVLKNTSTNVTRWINATTQANSATGSPTLATNSGFTNMLDGGGASAQYSPNGTLYIDLEDPSIYADLASAVGFTLNSFREFATIQQYLELDARGGTRYVESLYSQFGVTPEDARLQRSEYLGGQSFMLHTTPIAQTSETDAGTPQANLSGMGSISGGGHQFVKSFTEDGIIMAIASVRQEQRYQYGIHRMWSRTSRYDYYRPVFANLGEQTILNKEIYAQGTSTDDNAFGFQEAWAEYRYKPSIITGELKSNFAQSLDVWHLAQDPSSLPVLGQTFIEEDVPMDRVLAVSDEPDFIFQAKFNAFVSRAMPTRSIPGLNKL